MLQAEFLFTINYYFYQLHPYFKLVCLYGEAAINYKLKL